MDDRVLASHRATATNAMRQLNNLELGSSGRRHRVIEDALVLLDRLIDQVAAQEVQTLDQETLTDAILIRDAMREAGLGDSVISGVSQIAVRREMDETEDGRPALWRVDMGEDTPAVEGTAAQIANLIRRLAGKP